MGRVFIGGHAGSGTRVISHMLKDSGYFIGDIMGPELDYVPLYAVKGDLIFDQMLGNDTPHEYVRKLCGSWWPKEDWALKHGFLMLAIPTLRKWFPEAKIIITIRHGIDNILRGHNMDLDIGMMTCPKLLDGFNPLERRMVFWNWAYQEAIKMADAFGNVMFVQLEQLVNNPIEQSRRIAKFLGKEKIDHSFIKKPETIGRRNNTQYVDTIDFLYIPDEHKKYLKRIGQDTLKYFGYAKNSDGIS